MPKTINNAKNLRKCLKSLKMQKIPNQISTKMSKRLDFFELFSYLSGSHGLSAQRAPKLLYLILNIND